MFKKQAVKEPYKMFFEEYCKPTEALKDSTVGAEEMTPEEYSNYLMLSYGNKDKFRKNFALCFYNKPGIFKGQIEKTTALAVCFKRVSVEGKYIGGGSFSGKEDEVWIDKKGFESFAVGDCASFNAEVFRYIRTKPFKIIDFGLRNPTNIQKIELNGAFASKTAVRHNSVACEKCELHDSCSGTCSV